MIKEVVIAIAAVGTVLCAVPPQHDVNMSMPTRRIWAGISVDSPLVVLGSQKGLQVYFAIVNDTDDPVSPDTRESVLLVNDQVWPDSRFMFGNGPPGNRAEPLKTGDYRLFSYSIPDLFKNPGTYSIKWHGKDFESLPVMIRVLPRQ